MDIGTRIKELELERDSLIASTPLEPAGKKGTTHSVIRAKYNRKINYLKKYGVENIFDVPEIKEKHQQNIVTSYTDEVKSHMSQSHKAKWEDAAFRERMSQVRKELADTEEFKKSISRRIREYRDRPDVKRYYSQLMKDRWQSSATLLAYKEKRTQEANIKKSIKYMNNVLSYNKKFIEALQNFLTQAPILHENKYDYSSIVFRGLQTNVDIICPIHGKFSQSPYKHLQGSGCPKCGFIQAGLNGRLSTPTFIKKAEEVHGTVYDYSKVIYKTSNDPVTIVCPIHGPFNQLPKYHLLGCKCPKCKETVGERKIRLFLESHKITYKYQHIFPDCRDIRPLRFDFYLPDYNMCIEFDGIQHTQRVRWLPDSDDLYEGFKRRDNIKEIYCNNHGIKLIRIPYTEINNINTLLNSYIFER